MRLMPKTNGIPHTERRNDLHEADDNDENNAPHIPQDDTYRPVINIEMKNIRYPPNASRKLATTVDMKRLI